MLLKAKNHNNFQFGVQKHSLYQAPKARLHNNYFYRKKKKTLIEISSPPHLINVYKDSVYNTTHIYFIIIIVSYIDYIRLPKSM